MTTWIAIYGALLSTLVFILQFGSYVAAKRYLQIRIGRSIGPREECIEFEIANIGLGMTEIKQVMISNFAFSGEIGLHEVWGTGQKISKRRHWELEDNEGEADIQPLPMPYPLNAGEAVFLSITSKYLQNEMRLHDAISVPARLPGDVATDLFSKEVEHSRSKWAARRLFRADTNYLLEIPIVSRWRSRLSPLQNLKLFSVDGPLR